MEWTRGKDIALWAHTRFVQSAQYTDSVHTLITIGHGGDMVLPLMG
jgi:hypothetical protein